MKKIIYIICFTVLGVMVQFLVHSVIEILYINLLLNDFQKYGLGLSWNQWFTVHHIGTVVLLIIGILLGFWQGTYWWKVLYENKKIKTEKLRQS